MEAAPFKEGDIVNFYRGFWDRGLVIEVYRGTRGYHVVMQVPAEPEPGEETSTISLPVEGMTLVA
jgi:hypothetical protein